eukprot:gnl/Chilomastix_cuspidata/1786.p1 GENE.gnl/Chilomastix_cuspidata/1786~~gnl/Chilomastix_cuspidata/1786.p1  ORF type:complete len:505 (+),score=192.55 gnl/Chilomastix_cuspidata/1786:115-1515(+)
MSGSGTPSDYPTFESFDDLFKQIFTPIPSPFELSEASDDSLMSGKSFLSDSLESEERMEEADAMERKSLDWRVSLFKSLDSITSKVQKDRLYAAKRLTLQLTIFTDPEAMFREVGTSIFGAIEQTLKMKNCSSELTGEVAKLVAAAIFTAGAEAQPLWASSKRVFQRKHVLLPLVAAIAQGFEDESALEQLQHEALLYAMTLDGIIACGFLLCGVEAERAVGMVEELLARTVEKKASAPAAKGRKKTKVATPLLALWSTYLHEWTSTPAALLIGTVELLVASLLTALDNEELEPRASAALEALMEMPLFDEALQASRGRPRWMKAKPYKKLRAYFSHAQPVLTAAETGDVAPECDPFEFISPRSRVTIFVPDRENFFLFNLLRHMIGPNVTVQAAGNPRIRALLDIDTPVNPFDEVSALTGVAKDVDKKRVLSRTITSQKTIRKRNLARQKARRAKSEHLSDDWEF